MSLPTPPRVIIFFILLDAFVFPYVALAQSDGGAMGGPGGVATTVPETLTPSDPAPTPLETSAVSPVSVPRATTSSVAVPPRTPPQGVITPIPTPPRPVNPVATQSAQPIEESVASTTVAPLDDTATSNSLLTVVLAILALIPFGFLLARVLQKKNTDNDDCTRCYELETLLKRKWDELTDLKGMILDKVTDVAKDKVRDSVSGTRGGEILVRAEKLEEDYERLKKLFEECMIDFEKNAYRGILVENSLTDKKILEKMKINKTETVDDWTLHYVLLGRKVIDEFGGHMATGPWYAHFWKPEEDEMRVVFKDKTFTITKSDKDTWKDAIHHGESLGIPALQLDFSPNN